MADLQAKSTQPAASSIEQCAVSKKAPKELLVKYIELYHACNTNNVLSIDIYSQCCEASSRKTGCTYAMGHKFRVSNLHLKTLHVLHSFSSPENMRVTSEIVTACVNEKYPASVVQSKSLSMQESIHVYIQTMFLQKPPKNTSQL